MKRVHWISVCTLGVATLLIAAYFLSTRQPDYHRQMQPVYEVIAAGEQGWGTEGTRLLYAVIHDTPDKRTLAENLINESNGSLVAEGLILATQTGHPKARQLIREHLHDKRWNWYLANNDEISAELLKYLNKQTVQPYVINAIDMIGKA